MKISLTFNHLLWISSEVLLKKKNRKTNKQKKKPLPYPKPWLSVDSLQPMADFGGVKGGSERLSQLQELLVGLTKR